MKLSVIIPTYNRKETLEKCLKALSVQTYPRSEYEVLVVDDSSADGTESVVEEFRAKENFPVRYFRQPHRGPASARNLGIANAGGEIILFIGDDIIAEPALLARHARWHDENPRENAAMLGYVTWSCDMEITPFMEWLENGGPQFNYPALIDGGEADPARFFYTCNLSLKKDFLINNGIFDEDFPAAGFEDVELGHRLKGRGLTLIFNKKAAGWHQHYTSLKDACERMVRVGEARELFNRKIGRQQQEIPPSSTIRRSLRAFKLSLYYFIARFLEKRKIAEGVFRYVLSYYYFAGMERSRRAIYAGPKSSLNNSGK